MKHLQTHVQRKQLGMASASQDSSNKHKPLRTPLRESEEQQQQHVDCKNSTESATASKQKKLDGRVHEGGVEMPLDSLHHVPGRSSGASICKSSRCKDCGCSEICEHQRQRSRCKACGGRSICESAAAKHH